MSKSRGDGGPKKLPLEALKEIYFHSLQPLAIKKDFGRGRYLELAYMGKITFVINVSFYGPKCLALASYVIFTLSLMIFL